MSAKTFFRLAVFVGSGVLGGAGLRMLAGDSIAALLMGFCCTAVAACGLVVSIFGIPVLGRRQPDSGFGVFSDPAPARRSKAKPRKK